MCGGAEKSKSASSTTPSSAVQVSTNEKDMKTLTVNTQDSFTSLLELASNNDIEGFKSLSDKEGASSINEVGLWYVRQNGSKQVVLEHRTPLMVAATYGSIDVMKFILSRPEADVNFACGANKTTALHCAASGGSVNAIDAVNLLVSAGADLNCVDAIGNRPVDVIVVPPKLQGMKEILEELLSDSASDAFVGISVNSSSTGSPVQLSMIENGVPHSPSCSPPPLMSASGSLSEKKDPVDPSLPDIKNSIYTTDEFRMFSFKVRPCSRAYSHDWTECPFVHPGENARRRDPRKFHYSCTPCPEFRKGACRRGDMCEYAHGVFECWLHPAQYRTRLCKDGTSCNRRVCFFAHTTEELRPLYASTGSAVPSPRSSASVPNVMDMAAAMSLFPGSPSSVSWMSPSHFGQPRSPSANGIPLSSAAAAWAQQNVPALHLPGNNLQSSRLRSSLSARDIPLEDLNMLNDFDGQQHIMNDLSCYLQPRPSPVSISRSCRSKTLTSSNLEDLFSAEFSSSPRYSDQAAASVFSPTHKSAVLNQFQQLQSMLSPINTNVLSPKNVEHQLLQAPFSRMSPRSVEPISPMSPRLSAFAQHGKQPISPMSPRLSAFAQHEKQQQHLSISSRDLGTNNHASVVGSPTNTWSKWGSPNGKVDWSVNGNELSRQMQSSSPFNLKNSGEEEPDVSWVQSLVKDSSPEMTKEKFASSGPIASADVLKSKSEVESTDHSVLGAWLEQMQLDQLVV